MICPHCKSEFFVARGLQRDYVYKINKPFNYLMKMTYFCSYTCWRANGGGKDVKLKYAVQEPKRDDQVS